MVDQLDCAYYEYGKMFKQIPSYSLETKKRFVEKILRRNVFFQKFKLDNEI
jgi:hypothetical protein